MKPARFFVIPIIVLLVHLVPLSMAFGQTPLPCTSPAPHECDDNDGDGRCNEDEINGVDDDGDGSIDEDPYPPMCDWAACEEGGACSPYTLKYYRNIDLSTTNASISRAVIVVHGRRDERVTVDDRSWNYYNRIYNAADELGLLNEILILAPLFDRASKCPVTPATNQCITGAPAVSNPKCGGNADSDGRLCWGGPNPSDYPAGGNASNDENLRASSFLLVDDMINTLVHLKAIGIFPNLNTIVVTGQSAGGQFSLRYAMTGTAEPEDITMRYVPCNPGEVAFLNELRPTQEVMNEFPNRGYSEDCNSDGFDEFYAPPGALGSMSDTEAWSTYPVSYEFPSGYLWEDQDGNSVDCVSNNRFDRWPRGIANVSTGNDYMIATGATPNDVLTRYTARDVILLFGIDDNVYVNARIRKECDGKPADGPSVGSCPHALQGHARVERGAFFFKHVCCSFGCANHKMETVCIDDDGDGTCDVRLGHGGGIYRAGATREAVFFDAETDEPKQWGMTLGGLEDERALSVERTPQGGYIVLGEIDSTESHGAGGKDLWVVKLDDAGTTLWQNTYGGPENEFAAAITASPDGGYLLVGSTESVTAGGLDAWVLKIDEDGAAEWGRSQGGPLDDSGIAIVTSDDCNFVVGGTTTDPDTLERDIWLRKVDPLVGALWHKTYDSSVYESLSSLQRTRDGGFIVAGDTYHVEGRNSDFRALKVDRDGMVEWDKAYGLWSFVAPGAPRNENAEFSPSILQTGDGGYVLAGITVPTAGTSMSMAWLLRLTEDGDSTWQKLFRAPGGGIVSSLRQADDNGYLLSGTTGVGGDAWVAKLNENGGEEWINYYGGEGPALGDVISSLQMASDGGFIAVGHTESLAVSGEDLWILKLDEDGLIPGCPAIRPGLLVTEEDPSEEPVDISSGVDDALFVTNSWSVTMTQPPSDRVFEGDGCNVNILKDLIDLPRTGQTTSYHQRDDGHLRAGAPWPSLRFIDKGDGTVTDYLTGLTWLKDADCLGGTDWEDSMDNVAGFNQDPESYSCADYDTEDPKDDWRAPNINEIESLVNAEVEDNAAWLIEQGFVGVEPVWYWSSSSPVPTYRKWALHMEVGETSRSFGIGWPFPMWPVRGGQEDFWDPNYPANVWKTGQTASLYAGDDGDLQMGVLWPSNRLQDNGDGTVTDNLTGLVWLKDTYCFETPPPVGGMVWEDALLTVGDFNENPGSYDCMDYDVESHERGWRVPNRKELMSLLAWSRISPALPEEHPFLDVENRAYWSSTTYPNDPQSPAAWVAYPTGVGGLSASLKEHSRLTFWPVRGEPVPEPSANALRLSTLITLLALRRRR